MMELLEIFKKISTLNANFHLIGLIVMIAVFFFDREKLHIKLDSLAKFIALLVLAGAIKICLWNGQFVMENPYGFYLFNFLFVIFEDAYFVMIPHYLNKKIQNKYARGAVWVIFSILFASGHAYQGLMGVLVTSVYPYFLSNKYGTRVSFGTVMACHFLYDVFVTLLPKINNMLIY